MQYATLLAVLVFSCVQLGQLLHCDASLPNFSCREDERKALLQFKDGLQDPLGLLSSWDGMDCCSWWGVACSNMTGRVEELYLPSSNGRRMHGDEINPCLLALEELTYLNLGIINFHGATIPKFIGSFKRLTHLILSSSYLVGRVPPELGNLSSLQYLDLSGNSHVYMNQVQGLEIEDGSWLSRLSHLWYLNLNDVDIKNLSLTLQFIGMLPFIFFLHLASCSLTSSPRADLPTHVNFTSLRVLDLHSNHFNTTLPSWLFEIESLEYLDLSSNSFMGPVPSAMANLTSLKTLDLSGSEHIDGDSLYDAVSKLKNLTRLTLSSVNLKGELPHWLGDLKNLEILDLSYNQLNGMLTERRFQQLSNLVFLDLSGNYFHGVLNETHFEKLTRIEQLGLAQNSLAIDIGPDWSPPKLISLELDGCKVGPAFPAWLRKLGSISAITMSNAEISDVIPDWFWSFSSSISIIGLSNNMIEGKLPASLQHLNNLQSLVLSNNQLEGPFPLFPASLRQLFLSNNSMSNGKLNGGIPSSICKLKGLKVLDISGNSLSGEIPDCWDSNNNLFHVDLSNNKFSGTIPSSICSVPSLVSLRLERNNLSGRLPSVLQNCTSMAYMDLGNNKFSGSIPTWLGRMLPNLIVLRLRSNLLVGAIPREIGNISSLGILDLAHNMLSGPIPGSFANLNAMKHSYVYGFHFRFDGLVDVTTKGRNQEYAMTHDFPKTIDLSSNNLSGWIPEALTTLDGLQNLNLSSNHLAGTIPTSIRRLKYLESLDLSFNNLIGEIPATMADLNFLSYMNFSFNELSGRIPNGGQFGSHPDPSIYMGNADLCGFPLNVTCQSSGTSQPSQNSNNAKDIEEDEGIWFYVSATLGFVVGFWTFVGSLLLKREWRIMYYRYIDQTYDKFYVFVAVKIVSIRHR